jgi:DNA-directed RNA polymerase specialized sigma24 family protein
VGKGERSIQDEAVIKQILDGHTDDFRVIIDRYYSHLYRIVNAVLHHQKDAEDVTQEALVKIYRSLLSTLFIGGGLRLLWGRSRQAKENPE